MRTRWYLGGCGRFVRESALLENSKREIGGGERLGVRRFSKLLGLKKTQPPAVNDGRLNKYTIAVLEIAAVLSARPEIRRQCLRRAPLLPRRPIPVNANPSSATVVAVSGTLVA